MSLLEQIHAVSDRRASKADIVEYYKEKFTGKGANSWRQRLVSDIYDIQYGGSDHDAKEKARLKKNLSRNFDPSRLNNPGSKKNKEWYRELGEDLPMKPPECGYHVEGIVWIKYSEECVDREIDMDITGDDADAIAKMSSTFIEQAIVNLYNDVAPDETSSYGSCKEPELIVTAIDCDE